MFKIMAQQYFWNRAIHVSVFNELQKYHDEHKLKCYLKRHHPMFYINPLKEEEVYLKPHIVIYHDFVSKNEMNLIKQLAFPKVSTEFFFFLNT